MASQEHLIGVANERLELVLARSALDDWLDGAREHRELDGASLLHLLPAASHALLLVSRRVSPDVTLLVAPDGGRELAARAALVGSRTWLHLVVRDHVVRSRPSAPPFVGRERELHELEISLASPQPEIVVVHGPLGVGKTALLRAFARRCEELRCPTFSLDARRSPPPSSGLPSLLADAPPRVRRVPFEDSRHLPGARWVVLIDNVDAWGSLGAVVDVLCAGLPPECRVVASTRHPPVGWWDRTCTVRPIALGLLDGVSATALALQLGATPGDAVAIARRSGGHPLSVHALRSAPAAPATSESLAPLDLVEHDRRALLEIASMPIRVTEDALCFFGEVGDLAAAFDFVATIATRTADGVGLRLPPAVREAVRARLRQRNPRRFAALQTRLAEYYAQQVDESPAFATATVDEFLDAVDDRPGVRILVGARGLGLPETRALRPDEREAFERLVARVEDSDRGAAALRRVERADVATEVAESDGQLVGYCQYTALTAGQSEPPDPRDVDWQAAHELLRRQTTLEPGEHVLCVLGWAGTDTRQGVWGGPSQALFRHALGNLLRAPRASGTLFVAAHERFPLETRRIGGADAPVAVAGRHVVFRDLHRMSTADVLMAVLLTRIDSGGTTTPFPRPDVHVSADLVREALQLVDQPERLASLPLVSLRVVEQLTSAGATRYAKATALAKLLRETVAELRGEREDTQRQVLEALLTRRTKHETLAVELGLPYGTFRRHLTRGLERVAELVRTKELLARRSAGGQQPGTD